MRLINAATLKLQTFHTSPPPYAILSHTWTDEEITFIEDLNKCDQRKKGFYKIRQCCAQALQDGLYWAWVDTCCINKSSSSELAEAIQSMFTWYQEASVCYAYLEDVQVPGRLLKGLPNSVWDSPVLSALCEARWFRRGWTLQELVAPSKVVFYFAGWVRGGEKSSPAVIKTLEEITGIDQSVLRDPQHRDRVSVARRMSWASNRETSRVEDIAYCLFGIFDVNMPLLYGEGPKAFLRLQEEIMKYDQDQSLFAWKPVEKHWQSEPCVDPEPWAPGGRSIFANHPCEFAASSGFHGSLRGDEYTMTNKGIQIFAPVVPLNSPEIPAGEKFFLIGLRCFYSFQEPGSVDATGKPLWVCFAAQRVIDGDEDQYVRHAKSGLFKLSEERITRAGFRTIYLAKKMPTYRGSQLRTYPLSSQSRDTQAGAQSDRRNSSVSWGKRLVS